jgi:hypothetical protein
MDFSQKLPGYGRNWDSVGMYNTGPNPKLIKARREYARIIKSIYTVLLARKQLLRKAQAIPLKRRHSVKMLTREHR